MNTHLLRNYRTYPHTYLQIHLVHLSSGFLERKTYPSTSFELRISRKSINRTNPVHADTLVDILAWGKLSLLHQQSGLKN